MIKDKVDGVTELTDVSLKGQLWRDNVAMTATSADLNTIAGVALAGTTPVALATGYSVAKVFDKEVTCSNGTAVETAICTVPKGSLILDVMAWCTEAFNGAVTKTFQVGLTGNTDKYIDNADMAVTLDAVLDIFTGTNQDQKTAEPCGTAMAIVSTHTNTTGATAGKMKVKVIYA